MKLIEGILTILFWVFIGSVLMFLGWFLKGVSVKKAGGK